MINRKTCCGDVRFHKAVLRPGDATDVEVTLLLSDKFGAVDHAAEVVTDPPADEPIVLRTSAEAHPNLRVESETAGTPTVFIGTGDSHSLRFRVVATGSDSEPPVDLSGLTLKSALKVEWAAARSRADGDDGLTIDTRPFVVRLDSAGPAGNRSAEVALLDGQGIRLRQAVAWEVVDPIRATPRMAVFRPGQGPVRVLINAVDRRPFRVLRVECGDRGLHGRAKSPDAATTHMVELEGAPTGPLVDGRGVVTVVTDHPAQTNVGLNFVVVD